MRNINLLLISGILILFIHGCKKDFLEAKPSSSILRPETLDDYQNLLENYSINNSPVLATLAADEYDYISFQTWQSARTTTERNSFIWSKDIFGGEISGEDWSTPYQAVFYANNVLAGLNRIKDSEKNIVRFNFLKGWAFFTRAFAYFELVNNFSPVYDAEKAKSDLGVPLKLNPSIDNIQPRATVQETYDQILSDLNSAIPLLDAKVPANNREQPSKTAVHALLARIYLNMRKYDLSESEADSVLLLHDKLIDYNTVNLTDIEPFSRVNDELIFYKSANGSYPSSSTFLNTYTTIKPSLIKLYELNDLRLYTYFSQQPDDSYIVKIQYGGFTTIYPFTGLATDEVYLIKAECAARRNDMFNALLYLNKLLVKRYQTGTFKPITFSNSIQALNRVLLERQKELVWRNLRWDDLKRLNKEGANITLTRTLNGQIYTLLPNDPRYIFPIPDNEIQLSGIQQNIR